MNVVECGRTRQQQHVVEARVKEGQSRISCKMEEGDWKIDVARINRMIYYRLAYYGLD